MSTLPLDVPVVEADSLPLTESGSCPDMELCPAYNGYVGHSSISVTFNRLGFNFTDLPAFIGYCHSEIGLAS
ncbi:MAG: hypothetical protein JW944_02450 [Deltaproteobacteria bacterium]|nr:hypothetical protein [Deltaproteobacteria bacterium]